MIKTALEHFQDIKELEIADEPNVTVEELIPYKCKQVEKAILELKEIKEANPSEAMEDLNEIVEYITEDKKVKYKGTILFDCDIIKDALLKAQELEKENLELKKKIDSYERRIELYSSKQLETALFYSRNELAEYKKKLEIIKEKNVDSHRIKKCETVEEYNDTLKSWETALTEEEFKTLKEV